MPPNPSGIADYSEALVHQLRTITHNVTVFSGPGAFDPEAFDAVIYHLGNNPHHDFVYQQAMKHPGFVVLHEANLHHLVTHLTITAGDWDAYVAEAEYNGGEAARLRAEEARSLTVGPDYAGLNMTRRVLENSKGVIVHSRFMEQEVRSANYWGPLAVIPHGAWIEPVDGFVFRARLGVEPSAPLFGAFGYLKPYKRIAESLRAFRRLVKEVPEAKMILVGEPHSEFPVEQLIASLRLQSNVKVLGFTPIEDFAGYIAACDVVLNLRFPTVGESSGSLLRSFGLGRAVIVSDLGSFSEFPDDICLKTPVDSTEEEVLFGYMKMLATRPDLARSMGERAKQWVERECNWNKVAQQYAEFIKPPFVQAKYILDWAQDESARNYIETHRTRLEKTLDVIPRGAPEKSILEMGSYLQITPALHTKLGYGFVRGCYYGRAGRIDHKDIYSAAGEHFTCEIDHFDAERDRFPYEDESFDTVVCGELIEHLFQDPMHMMGEINRILKPSGSVVLTTPNIASLRGVSAILQGYHPGFFHAYIKPNDEGDVDARHNREYTPGEIHRLLVDSGFEVELLETGNFSDGDLKRHAWAREIIRAAKQREDLRDDGIYAVGRKVSDVVERWPGWLYS